MKYKYVLPAFFLSFIYCNGAFSQQRQTSAPGHTKWAQDYPIVMPGDWDMKPLFMHRVGGDPVWQPDNYAKEHTEETIKKYKETGATILMLHFYKGFGLQAEKEEIEDARKMVPLCRKYGLKVGAYVGATMAYETFLVENPAAKDWIVPEYMGKPVTYGSQTFRKLVYFQHPGYKAYMKRVLKVAVSDLKVDLIHFDNASVQAIPPVFYHPLAIQQFREYLTKKYTPAMLKKRFGFSNVSYVEPPLYSASLARIDDPMKQEWIDFRCQQLADYYAEMEQYIHSLNPEVAVECNPHGLGGNNTMWDYSVDFPRLLAHTDYFASEGEETELTDEGALLCKIRTFKMARTLNNRVFNLTHGSRLLMAEDLAYNRQGIGIITSDVQMQGLSLANKKTQGAPEQAYINFFREHYDYYRTNKNIADVAILHQYNTMAYHSDRPYQSTFLYEQALIQYKVPFDIIFDEQLKNLPAYKVLVLADQECLSDEQLQLIKDFVKNGGGLVVTEHTSLYTTWHQRKADFGLKGLINITPPDYKSRTAPEDIVKVPVQQNEYEKGRVVYIPEVKPALPKPAGAPMRGKYMLLPLNAKDLINAVEWAAGNNLSAHIDGPFTLTMELTERIDKSAMMLHLVNYNYEKAPASNINVDFVLPTGKKVKQVKLMTPDGQLDSPLTFTVNDARIHFTVPSVKIYSLIAVDLE